MITRLSLTVLTVFFVFIVAGCNAVGPGLNLSGGAGGANGKGSSGAGGAASSGASTATFSNGAFMTGVAASAGASMSGPCTGLQCQIHACSGGATTTISGTIYDPAGKNPLYGIVAYVPNTKPSAFPAGASCSTCADLYTGDPIAAAVTDPTGKFTIKYAPDGPNIPLVIQVGKWRRQFVLPSVAMCKNTEAPMMLSLPKNASEGDIPNIAISTGSADTLECLLVRVGLDEAEYVPGASSAGHIHIFQGGGNGGGKQGGAPNTNPPGPDPAQSLWDSDADIKKYDIVILSCEGHETTSMNQQVMFDYAAAGGRIFASHYHYAWFNSGPFGAENPPIATWTPGSAQIGNSLQANVVTTLWNGKPFQKGQAMLQWLGGVGALTNGELTIYAPRHNADLSATNTPSQPWLVASQSTSVAQDFSFDTPLGVPEAQQCGRVVFSDMHVGATASGQSNDYTNGQSKTTPQGCSTSDLSAQEDALEFILFDLSSCVTPGNTTFVPDAGIPQMQ